MAEIINGIETRNRGGIIEIRTEKGWKITNNEIIIKAMIQIHDENITNMYPTIYA